MVGKNITWEREMQKEAETERNIIAPKGGFSGYF